MRVSHEQTAPVTPEKTFDRLQAFIDERRSWKEPCADMECFERKLHDYIVTVEREVLAEELARLDVDLPAVTMRCPRPIPGASRVWTRPGPSRYGSPVRWSGASTTRSPAGRHTRRCGRPRRPTVRPSFSIGSRSCGARSRAPRSSGSPGSDVRFLPACGGQATPWGAFVPPGAFSQGLTGT
jgi:hypothetical protein